MAEKSAENPCDHDWKPVEGGPIPRAPIIQRYFCSKCGENGRSAPRGGVRSYALDRLKTVGKRSELLRRVQNDRKG